MQINYKYILLFAFLGLWTGTAKAQSPKLNFTLTESETGTIRDYRAVNFVSLQPGFTYSAQSGKIFKARIDRTIPISVVTVSNPQPGSVNTSVTTPDKAYTPGGSYSSDPIQGVSGISSSPQKVSGSSGNTVSNVPVAYIYPILWFKTVPVTNNQNGAYKWMDVTGNKTMLNRYSSSGAGTGTEFQATRDTMRSYNFNPALYMATDDVSKEILLNKSNLTQATVMGVWGANADFEKDKFIFAINGRRNEGIVFTKQYVEQGDVSKEKLIYGTSPAKNLMASSTNIDTISKFRENALRIATYYRANKPSTSLWGEAQKAVISMGGKFDTANVNNTSHFKIAVNETATFKGYTPELLVFDRQLSAMECSKFETYLAIKYGLTLDKSYVAADGSVLWDYAANNFYHHRVTGYGREDGLGLYQKMSTTSNEEKPWYADQRINDSYDTGDSYRLSSHNRLLVMGYQPGNTPVNSNYVMCGDNDDTLKFTPSTIPGVPYKLKREWLVNTNQPSANSSSKTLGWLSNTIVGGETNFKCNISKNGSLNSLSAVTQDTLKGPDGYFAWTVEQEYGPITVKFGAKTAELSSYDYGYKIDSVGYVFAIQKGSLINTVLFSIAKGQRLEIEKSGRVMYLRVNGVRYQNTEIAIDSACANKTFYGSVSIGSNPYNIKLTDFRHGGFVDTGNKIEISYSRLGQLAAITKSNVYLLVNRTETAVGLSPDVIACDEVDATRSKLIFNNVFWEGNRDGKYAFGIGYYTPTMQNVAKQHNQTQQQQEPDVQGDLKIYYPDMHDMSNLTVKLQTAKPTPSTILVFDISGRNVFHKELPESRDVTYTTIKLPTSGVFIVKVINNETQLTRKVISQ